MKRSEFLVSMAGGAFAASGASGARDEGPFPRTDVEIERDRPGKPGAGKVLAAIQPHADDLPLYAGGLVLKLIAEGYTGYLIRTTNDDHTGPGTVGEGVLANERDNFAVAKAFGLKKTYDLYYRNHMLDAVSPLELRLRLIFLFRLLKVDTVVCYDPWSEQMDAGLAPHSVTEKYYFARGPQVVNRVVDTTNYMDGKIAVNLLNTAQGPAGQQGAQLRRRLKEQGLRLPLLGDDDATANREYTRQFVLARDAETGRRFGLSYAEAYHYIGPRPPAIDEYVRQHAVKL